jgi:hypothetical protein
MSAFMQLAANNSSRLLGFLLPLLFVGFVLKKCEITSFLLCSAGSGGKARQASTQVNQDRP